MKAPRRSHVRVRALAVLAFAFLSGCEPTVPDTPTGPVAGSAVPSGSARQPAIRVLDSGNLRRLMRELSEPDRGFISDNYLSNETSYLEVVPELARRAPGGVYIGVGPEQNFTYLAALRPDLAFIVDIRRDNLLLHLLYKAMFELADSRLEFLCLWLSRDCGGESDFKASVEQVFAQLRKQPASSESFERSHRRLLRRLEQVHGFELTQADRRAMRRAHGTFHREQLATAFRLKQMSGRRYPTLEELMVSEDSQGEAGSFLGSEDSYRLVRKLQLDNRVIFVVGDFAGRHALELVAREIRRRGLLLNAFYVSNVEQYLLGDRATWQRWMDNLFALPARGDSVIIRAHLDQGKPHPLQRPGHRSTTVAQPWSVLGQQRERHDASLLELSSEAP